MFSWLFPKKYFPDGREMSSLEESQHWFLECVSCGAKRSYAELGATRYRASTTGKRMLGKCSNCNKYRRLRTIWIGPKP